MSTGSGELVVKPGAGALVAVSEQLTVKKRPPKKPLEEEEFTEVRRMKTLYYVGGTHVCI